ncbi:hypothetical protein F5J12DRAFT_914786 [Pisolithus orientalis]|uniref:uncharacterized protein n=1 Tax=Pisolithus orientalis TaxID=936130 RepID=UPI0022253678|nr:uncharacterized protein F5J12DRAFT_914786 [Pisolithus orientalis]KAI5997681.1 hypothetical protein F5J12DRAFT_914786 [Pisolithus orientalis]
MPNEMTSPLAHRSSGLVRTPGNAQGCIDNASDVPSIAIAQLVHELGSMLQSHAPDPPAMTGVDRIVHAEDDGFMKPCSPACSNVLLVLMSVLLDQNRWPAWMCNESEVITKNEDEPSPKVLWSDLVENDEELRKVILQWFGNPVVMDKNDQPEIMKHGQSVSDASILRFTAEVKGKWKVPAHSETSEEHPVDVNIQHSILEQEEQDENTRNMIMKLKEASLVKQLNSAEALICEQQAIIESFKHCMKHESINLGPSGLSIKQKERVNRTDENIGSTEPNNTNATKYYSTSSMKPVK